MDKKIIVLVGMSGSGKGSCTDYLEDKGLPKVYFGGMVYEEIKKRGLDKVRDEKFVRIDMREKEGKAVLAKRAAQKADDYFEQGYKYVVFDGLYSWTEFKYLKEKYHNNLLVICTVSDMHIRRQRALTRKDGRSYTHHDLDRRDIQEIENIEKGGPIAFADYYILNNYGYEELYKRLQEILEVENIKI